MVSVETVGCILQAADRWDAPGSRLRALCMDFILANYEVVVGSPVYEELQSSPHLLVEISRAAVEIVKGGEGGGEAAAARAAAAAAAAACAIPAAKRQRRA